MSQFNYYGKWYWVLFLLWRQLLYLRGSPGARKREESDWWEVALKSPLELLMMIPTYTYKWLTYNLAFYFLLCFTSRENKESIGGVCTETEQMCPFFFSKCEWSRHTPLFTHCDKIEFCDQIFFTQKLSILIIVKIWFWRFFNSFFLSAGKKIREIVQRIFFVLTIFNNTFFVFHISASAKEKKF